MTPKGTTKTVTLILGIGLTVLIGGFLALQLVPVEKSNSPVVREPNWDSPQTRALMKRSCFDCHSNETKWPWYSNIAPVSWMISGEVQEGRHALNYSEWRPNEEDESIEVLLEGEMPPRQYLLLHPEARLTNSEREALIAGLKKTFGSSAEAEHESGEEESRQNEDDDYGENEDDD